ncbi:N-acetylmuramoyl-L-alanine amidase [Streptomyces sp. NPDC096136]|uniref:peptidoglycan recognition protein family protein n=1 Tax=Streptomyces sp. NPDC096136 TaxID=3366076 RepID=UPI00380B3397
MADPLSADAFLAALRAEGVNVVEHDGWRTHNRNHKGPWGPVHGVVVHHTVSSGSASTVALCRDGYDELPGPLCHGVITKDGAFHLIGYGRTNHAGGGDPAVLQVVTDESYGDRPPGPHFGNSDGTDGNRAFYGWECENLGDGRDPWPDVQLDTIERASAAVCRAHGWSAKSVIGHLEWSDDKSDPKGFTMPWMRDRIAARLGNTPTAPPATPAPTVSVSLSRLIAAAKADPPRAGTPVSYSGVKTVEDALVAEGLLAAGLADGHFGTATVTAYAKWQRRQGYSGPDADGIPGRASLVVLAARHGFTITS